MRVNLRESAISITAHLKPRRKMSPQVKTVFDRIVKENPTISNDSAYALARREVRASRKARSARMDGEVIAERIIAFRTINGPFSTVDQLLNVEGIGTAKLEQIETYICIGG